jgi:hypothetical protein
MSAVNEYNLSVEGNHETRNRLLQIFEGESGKRAGHS